MSYPEHFEVDPVWVEQIIANAVPCQPHILERVFDVTTWPEIRNRFLYAADFPSLDGHARTPAILLPLERSLKVTGLLVMRLTQAVAIDKTETYGCVLGAVMGLRKGNTRKVIIADSLKIGVKCLSSETEDYCVRVVLGELGLASYRPVVFPRTEFKIMVSDYDDCEMSAEVLANFVMSRGGSCEVYDNSILPGGSE